MNSNKKSKVKSRSKSNDVKETNNKNGSTDAPFFSCDPEQIFCFKCGNQYAKIEDLNTHFTSVKECHTLENEKYLEQHLKRIVGKNLWTKDSDKHLIQKGMIFCITCGDHFSFIEELAGHCALVENCQTLQNEKYLAKHMNTPPQSDNSEENRYSCAFCEKSFPWMSSLTRHVSKDHDKSKRAKIKASSTKKKQNRLENYEILKSSLMISEEFENGSFEVKQTFLTTNGTIPESDKDNVIIKSQETQDFSEYLLPHGWKKIGRKRKKIDDKRKWDFTVLSPDGKRIKSNFALNQYLKRNPEVKCDLNVTNTSYPESLGLNWHLQNTSGLPLLMKNGKLPLPPDISGDLP